MNLTLFTNEVSNKVHDKKRFYFSNNTESLKRYFRDKKGFEVFKEKDTNREYILS
jgi:hypothetical protein